MITIDKCQWLCIIHVIQAIYRNKDGHLQSWARIDLYGRLPYFRLLTHWSPGNFNSVFLLAQVSHFMDAYISWISWLCPQKATEHIWWLVNTSSRYGLVPLSSKPLPEPMLTQIYIAIWPHWATLVCFRRRGTISILCYYLIYVYSFHESHSYLVGAVTA